jgi:hypothetical protein
LERTRAEGADADALETVPGSPSGSERSNSLRSPHRGGKLLSSRDSARLRLISKRLRRDRDHASKLSPVKTRAARRAEKESEKGSSRNGGRRDAAPGKTAVLAKREAEEEKENDARNVTSQTPNKPDAKRRSMLASSSDPKSVKRWLAGSARASSAVGRGARGEGRGWDDDEETDANAVSKKTRRRVVEDVKDALLSANKKRRRAYDELDEEYDRGRVAKHARRREAKQKLAGKAPAFGSKRSAAAGSKRNPFQSKARSKASDA